jgi:translation initiation factor 2 subunit 1
MSKKKAKVVEEDSDEEPVVEVERVNFHQRGRFYEHEFPEVETNVLVQILKIDDKSGAYASLLEYDGKEAMINLSEISKRRIRSMTKILRIGSTEVCLVVSVDENKGYINLSKKRVESEDVAPKHEQFARAKTVHMIMQHVASLNNVQVEELCSKVSWPLHHKYKDAYEAFKQHVNKETNIWDECDFSKPGEDLSALAEKLKADIEVNISRRLTQSSQRLQAKVEVTCSEYDGIDAVKEALKEGFKASKADCEVNIKLIAHPSFALTCYVHDKEMGIQILEDAMERIKVAIKEKGGEFEIKSKPDVALKEKPEEPGSGSSSGSEASDQEDMGDLDEEAMKQLDAIKVEKSDGEESDEEDKKEDGDKKTKGAKDKK